MTLSVKTPEIDPISTFHNARGIVFTFLRTTDVIGYVRHPSVVEHKTDSLALEFCDRATRLMFVHVLFPPCI